MCQPSVSPLKWYNWVGWNQPSVPSGHQIIWVSHCFSVLLTEDEYLFTIWLVIQLGADVAAESDQLWSLARPSCVWEQSIGKLHISGLPYTVTILIATKTPKDRARDWLFSGSWGPGAKFARLHTQPIHAATAISKSNCCRFNAVLPILSGRPDHAHFLPGAVAPAGYVAFLHVNRPLLSGTTLYPIEQFFYIFDNVW